jgi:photosystem II stability/assembly factor-like uncharacterized protein
MPYFTGFILNNMLIHMKKHLLFILTISFYLSCTKDDSTPTTTLPSPGLDTLNGWIKGNRIASEMEDVWFLDNKNGIAASSTSLMSTSDSGNNWAVIGGTNSFGMINLQFVDGLNGFGQSTTQLGRTNDGGKTWTLKPLATNYGFTFQFITPAIGFYNDFSKGIYKTVDSGNTWKLVYDGSGKGPNFLFNFLDSLTGFTMINANCSKTVDGAVNWQPLATNITSGNFGNYFQMQFIDTLTGYCGTPDGLFKTTDGGKTWNNKLVRATTFMVPKFLDANHGYCIAANTIYRTDNGGNSWTVSCQLGQDDFSGMYFLDINTGWASTFGGYVLRLRP